MIAVILCLALLSGCGEGYTPPEIDTKDFSDFEIREYTPKGNPNYVCILFGQTNSYELGVQCIPKVR